MTKKSLILFSFFIFPTEVYSQSQDEVVQFAPVNPPKEITAGEVSDRITIDGRLDEGGWKSLLFTSGFFQVQPYQGAKANPDTHVKVLYDKRFLYVAAFCRDSLGRKGVRVPDLRRDFEFFTNDLFGIAIDPFRDKRNAIVFQTNPHGAQRDILAFDDQFFDREWDALWKVRTSRTDSGWVAEMAIPWKTLRYPKDSVTWGINFLRIARNKNQFSGWNPYPRSTNNYRMAYEGLLQGIKPPPPSANFRINPFLLYNADRQQRNENTATTTDELKIGGEVKWAINPFTVLDLTFNTDFAQADVDRQVNNLTRFSVFFPERRQFFLENASLFIVGQPQTIQPFFSRKVGLDPLGNPIAIDAGARLVSRTQNRSYGGLLLRQRANENFPASTFGVARYSKNFGEQNRVGGLFTSKIDDATDSTEVKTNFTYTADAFIRLSPALSWNISGSLSNTSQAKSGFSATSQIDFQNNKLAWYYYQTVVSKAYDPQVGFVYDKNIINTDFGGYRIIRKSWVPKPLRQIDPGFYAHIFNRASDGKFLQAELEIFPLYAVFLNGGLAYAFVVPTWQNLPEPISIVGIPLAAGNYQYNRYRFYYGNDQSRKFSFGLLYETGGYYNGALNRYEVRGRFSPIPNVAFSVNFQHNQFQSFGENNTNQNTNLITPELRLALNPRIQLITFYQYNTVGKRGVLNGRFSWEYAPLSFIYFVYNDNRQQVFNSTSLTTDQLTNQNAIFKISLIKQF